MSLFPTPSHPALDTLSGNEPEWQVIHHELVALSLARSAQDHAIGVALCAAQAAGVPSQLGYGSLFEYAHHLFGFKPREVEDRLRVAERLRHLPEMDAALCDGALCWAAVRELGRVASPETEREWLSAAEGKSVRQIEKMTSGRGPGDRPDDKPKPELRRHVLRLELSGEAMALWRDAAGKLRRDAGGGIDDEQAPMLMARHVLGGPTEEGRASYQISITLRRAAPSPHSGSTSPNATWAAPTWVPWVRRGRPRPTWARAARPRPTWVRARRSESARRSRLASSAWCSSAAAVAAK